MYAGGDRGWPAGALATPNIMDLLLVLAWTVEILNFLLLPAPLNIQNLAILPPPLSVVSLTVER
jgi:hypothetical protein